MAQQGVSADVHLERAARHRKIGDHLCEAGDEWGAVCYFYSAYHLVKNALLTDPVFDEPTALSRIDVTLQPDDRYTSRHHGRLRQGQAREWGINELVTRLYLPISASYERLHQASIAVRYGAGLTLPLDRIVSAVEAVQDAHSAGGLRVP